MSHVTGVILCMDSAEDTVYEDGPAILLVRINEWLAQADQHRHHELRSVEDHFGGSKHPQMLVYGGGFNYFPDEEFADFVMALPWEYPEDVVLILGTEHDGTKVYRPPNAATPPAPRSDASQGDAQ